MKYFSTRGKSNVDSTAKALLMGLADDGGLFLPEYFNKVELSDDEIENLNYTNLAYKVISNIFDDLDGEKLKNEIEEAYKDFPEEILPVSEVGDIFVMELYHGKTRAFKDFALSLLPRLIKLAKEQLKIDEKILVLTATSGDTGSAAISGFANVDDTKIMVFYPTDGISMVQRTQMINSGAENASAIAIEGNFDDAQSALKILFNDENFKRNLKNSGYLLTSANSINIGRLVPQIAYYFYAYYLLVQNEVIKNGEEIAVSVPTGNFGNILASYIAKKMGLPIKDFICASNKNNVLEDFIKSGVYDSNRKFYKTNSPSMDILISSNLERYLYLRSQNSEEINSIMTDLKDSGVFEFKHELDMYAYSCDEEETLNVIKNFYDEYGYLVDTHTAIAVKAAKNYLNDNPGVRVFVTATASAIKFPNSIAKALDLEYENEKDALYEVANFMNDIEFAQSISELNKETVIEKNDIKRIIEEMIF